MLRNPVRTLLDLSRGCGQGVVRGDPSTARFTHLASLRSSLAVGWRHWFLGTWAVSVLVGLFITWLLCYPQSQGTARGGGTVPFHVSFCNQSFHNLILEVTPRHFCPILVFSWLDSSLWVQPRSRGVSTRGGEYQEVGITGYHGQGCVSHKGHPSGGKLFPLLSENSEPCVGRQGKLCYLLLTWDPSFPI